MIRIHTQSVGQPQTIPSENGAITWRSAIFREPVTGPVALGPRGLDGDQVADTENHGSPDQAVCCHPLEHYALWNDAYALTDPGAQLGPGGVGENWTVSGADEHTVCVGDVFKVGGGGVRVQVSAPRFPCAKQERRTGLPDFLRRTMETRRTGWYLRVLTPGTVAAGDALTLESRPQPELTVERVNAGMLVAPFDVDFAAFCLDVPELAEGWKQILRMKLNKEWPD
jgi:MOSC domain-containing protein YiiM